MLGRRRSALISTLKNERIKCRAQSRRAAVETVRSKGINWFGKGRASSHFWPRMKYRPLIVKRSGLPGSGLGLFAGKEIPKGGVVVEYAGRRRKWRDIKHLDGRNKYLLTLNRTIAIDARPYSSGVGRFVNDAVGPKKVHGLRNNAEYVIRGGRVFIEATRRIRKGEEILVGYGRDFWKLAEKSESRR